MCDLDGMYCTRQTRTVHHEQCGITLFSALAAVIHLPAIEQEELLACSELYVGEHQPAYDTSEYSQVADDVQATG